MQNFLKSTYIICLIFLHPLNFYLHIFLLVVFLKNKHYELATLIKYFTISEQKLQEAAYTRLNRSK